MKSNLPTRFSVSLRLRVSVIPVLEGAPAFVQGGAPGAYRVCDSPWGWLVEKARAMGWWLLLLGLLLPSILPAATSRDIARETAFGQQGTADGEFRAPTGMALAGDRGLYVADVKRDLVSRFSVTGKCLGALKPRTGVLEGPLGVAVDPQGNVFVTESRRNQVRKFDASGAEVAVIGRTGSANGLFGGPRGLACNSRGHILVADYYNSRIQQLDNDGRFVRSYVYPHPETGVPVQPRGVGVDLQDRVYGLYPATNTVCRFGSGGKPEQSFGGTGRQPGQLSDPRYIAFDSRDFIYVSEAKNHRIQKFNASGEYVATFGGRGSSPGQFLSPQGVALDAEGNLYVVDGDNCRVQILSLNDFRRNLNLGLHFFRLRDYARSAVHYEEVLRADPAQKEAIDSLIVSYQTLSDRAIALKDTEGAKRYLAGILKLKPGNADARRKLRGLVWTENRSDVYYPTVALGIVLALVFLGAVFFKLVKG